MNQGMQDILDAEDAELTRLLRRVPYNTIQSNPTITTEDLEDERTLAPAMNLYWAEREAFLKRVTEICVARKVRSVKGIRRVHNELRRKENNANS